jgi:GcrA cell cycle regulator
MMCSGSPWSDNETSVLIELWPTHSATQIARRLNRTRSEVGAKARRLKLAGMLPVHLHKNFAVDPMPTPLRPRRARPMQAIMLKPLPVDAGLIMRPCSLLELEADRCRWPIGDVEDRAVLFCGGVVEGKRYCAGHARIAKG